MWIHLWTWGLGVYPTSSANYRPLISSAVTATLFLHVNDSQMGPHILPAARTKLSLKQRESEGCHSSSQLALARWQRARRLVREITTTPQILPFILHLCLHHRLCLIWARSWGDTHPRPLLSQKEKGELWVEVKAVVARAFCGLGGRGGEVGRTPARPWHCIQTRTGWKHKARLSDSPILFLPQGEWKELHETAIRYGPLLVSLSDSHRFCENSPGNGQRGDEWVVHVRKSLTIIQWNEVDLYSKDLAGGPECLLLEKKHFD